MEGGRGGKEGGLRRKEGGNDGRFRRRKRG